MKSVLGAIATGSVSELLTWLFYRLRQFWRIDPDRALQPGTTDVVNADQRPGKSGYLYILNLSAYNVRERDTFRRRARDID